MLIAQLPQMPSLIHLYNMSEWVPCKHRLASCEIGDYFQVASFSVRFFIGAALTYLRFSSDIA